MLTAAVYFVSAILLSYLPERATAHGRMLEPVSRMSAYLAGFATPTNYNDHEMNCGGRVVQWQQNGGKCGICGDPWSGPRLYERPAGALVQHNITTKTYKQNGFITIRIQITANHGGWCEFRLCNVADSGGIEASHACLNKHLLADENGQTRFNLEKDITGFFEYILVLPEDLTCEHCVLQWKWKCGNDWGCDTRCCVGCGEVQEEFYACSDIVIEPRDSRPTISTLRTTTATTTTTLRTTTRPPASTFLPPVTTQSPTTRPSTTQSPTTRPSTTMPTTKKSYGSIIDYIKENPAAVKPKNSSLIFHNGASNNVYTVPTNNDFLRKILGSDIYEVRDGHLWSSGNKQDLDQNQLGRLCAFCFYGCHLHDCSSKCPHICQE